MNSHHKFLSVDFYKRNDGTFCLTNNSPRPSELIEVGVETPHDTMFYSGNAPGLNAPLELDLQPNRHSHHYIFNQDPSSGAVIQETYIYCTDDQAAELRKLVEPRIKYDNAN